MKNFYLHLLASAALVLVSCKPRTFNAATQSSDADDYSKQFEITRFTACKNSKGQESGGLDFVWRVKKSSGEGVSPYILGFAGAAETVDGKKVEFRSMTTIDEPRYRTPKLTNSASFPVESYFAASLQYPADEVKSGWGYLRVNGKNTTFSDIFGGTFVIPKSASAGAFANRYFIVTGEGATLEFNCQPMSDVTRDRMRTYLVKDGSHGFTGGRGPVISSGSAETPTPVATPTRSAAFDLRPPGRPASYDVQFRHERIYDCSENGAVDVIWRQASSDGKAIALKSQYILGLAAHIKDANQGEVKFSSVSMDGAPAFSAGSAPSPVSYRSPMFFFDDAEVKSKLSYHSPIPGLTGRTVAAGGTLWVPFDGSGNGISVAVALGSTVRGSAFQVIADCSPKNEKIGNWLTSCVGRESVGSNGGCQH
ncbi:MAG: hypothetical protein FJY29_09940 [Betaproteobacteria bacterium]|nr:hypothetical protein [Betaproteobacteria bacterium]